MYMCLYSIEERNFVVMKSKVKSLMGQGHLRFPKHEIMTLEKDLKKEVKRLYLLKRTPSYINILLETLKNVSHLKMNMELVTEIMEDCENVSDERDDSKELDHPQRGYFTSKGEDDKISAIGEQLGVHQGDCKDYSLSTKGEHSRMSMNRENNIVTCENPGGVYSEDTISSREEYNNPTMEGYLEGWTPTDYDSYYQTREGCGGTNVNTDEIQIPVVQNDSVNYSYNQNEYSTLDINSFEDLFNYVEGV